MFPNRRAAGTGRFILFLLGTSQLLLPVVVGCPRPASKHPLTCSLTTPTPPVPPPVWWDREQQEQKQENLWVKKTDSLKKKTTKNQATQRQ